MAGAHDMMRAGALSWCPADLARSLIFLDGSKFIQAGADRPPNAILVFRARGGTLSPRAFMLLKGTYGLSQRNQHPLAGRLPDRWARDDIWQVSAPDEWALQVVHAMCS